MELTYWVNKVLDLCEQGEILAAHNESLILADWLEERGDIRALKLRAMSAELFDANVFLGELGELCSCYKTIDIIVSGQLATPLSNGLKLNVASYNIQNQNIIAGQSLYLDDNGYVTGNITTSMIGFALRDFPSNCTLCNNLRYIIKDYEGYERSA